MLVFPTINGTKAFGFAESEPSGAGESVHGVLQLTPADALRIQYTVERGEPLSYCGPVWISGMWKIDAFLISLSDVHIAPGAPARLRFSKAASDPGGTRHAVVSPDARFPVGDACFAGGDAKSLADTTGRASGDDGTDCRGHP